MTEKFKTGPGQHKLWNSGSIQNFSSLGHAHSKINLAGPGLINRETLLKLRHFCS